MVPSHVLKKGSRCEDTLMHTQSLHLIPYLHMYKCVH